MTKYKPLPLTYKRNTNHLALKQVKRSKSAAIYQCYDINGEPMDYYEIVSVGRSDERQVGNHTFEASETYPGKTVWGKKAFTECGWSAALAKFKELDK